MVQGRVSARENCTGEALPPPLGAAGTGVSAPLGLSVVSRGSDQEASGRAASAWRLADAPGVPLTWLCSPRPGRPERVEAGPLAGAQSGPGRASEAGGRQAAPSHGGRLRVGSMPRGSRALGASGGPTGSRHPRASLSPAPQKRPSVRVGHGAGPRARPGQVRTRCWRRGPGVPGRAIP